MYSLRGSHLSDYSDLAHTIFSAYTCLTVFEYVNESKICVRAGLSFNLHILHYRSRASSSAWRLYTNSPKCRPRFPGTSQCVFPDHPSLVRRSIGTIRASYKEHESEWSRSACHPATRLRQGFLSEADHKLRPILARAMAISSVQVVVAA